MVEAAIVREWRGGDWLPAEAECWVKSADLWSAERNGRVVAMAASRAIADDEWELLYIGTESADRRTGAATALLNGLVARCPGTWFLEVRESNAAARGLYEKLGFEFRGRRWDYYSDPAEDALVLGRARSAIQP